MTTPGQRDLLATGAAWLLAAYSVVLVFMLLAPSPAAPSWLVLVTSALAADAGVPAALATPERIEFVLNTAAFAPVSLLGSVVRPTLGWRDWTALGFAASMAVEAVQAVAMVGRSASHADVVANTLGALAGAVVGLVLLRPRTRD